MYIYSPNLYSLWDSIVKGETQNLTLAQTIKNDFNSSYIVVTKRDGLEQFRENLKNTEYFNKLYEDDEAIIYKINKFDSADTPPK
jgi:beta-lactamase class D